VFKLNKAIIFVDANNWYHNVKKIFQPGLVDIKKVAEFLCKVKNYELIQIRWYASTPSIKDGETNYYKHMSFLKHLEKKGIKVIKRKLQMLSNKEIINKRRDTIKSLDLCKHCKPIVESVFLDLSDIKRKEKGIDVWIAVDMIKKSIIDKECNVCILISGDADFVPSLDIIKNKSIEVLTASVPFGYSSELRRKETLQRCFADYKDKK